jgi:uncharacterized protein (DUF169 family)
MENAQLAQTLTDGLRLERPPVALAFVDQPPAEAAAPASAAPAACTFWRRAQQELFYAGPADHYECPIGAMTMGFPLPPEEAPKAEELVGTMVGLGYFAMEEVAHLPSVAKPHQGIVYGPLASFPLAPDAVIVQATPFQAMVLAEASEGVVLREAPALAAMGRPACAALARAANESTPTLSLGCIGARTYAELPDDRALLMLPGSALERTAERLLTLVQANQTLARHHAAKKARFAEP